jgi:glycosyltransferase involved in cell wall biosynthesis
MRIALIVPGGVDRSGTERVIPCILWLIERLASAGHDVQVFAMRQEAEPASWDLLGARVHNIGGRASLPRLVAAILAEHRRARFDVLHGFWLNAGGAAAAIAGKLIGRPAILTLAGGELEAIGDIGYGGMLTWRSRRYVGLAARLATHVTAPSAHACARAASLGIRASHVPLGVALDRWPPRLPQPRDMGMPIRLLHIASLNRVKDQQMLLRAAHALREMGTAFELSIIGEDTLGGEIQRLAAALGLSDVVHFAGFRPHEALRPWVEQADLLVMSSRHEAGPLVTLEAAVAGVPTVGTVVGHIADLAPEGAVAVPVGDHRALAEAIRTVASAEARRVEMARVAQSFALTHDADATFRAYCELHGEPFGVSA